jgi:hypothetical protein
VTICRDVQRQPCSRQVDGKLRRLPKGCDVVIAGPRVFAGGMAGQTKKGNESEYREYKYLGIRSVCVHCVVVKEMCEPAKTRGLVCSRFFSLSTVAEGTCKCFRLVPSLLQLPVWLTASLLHTRRN